MQILAPPLEFKDPFTLCINTSRTRRHPAILIPTYFILAIYSNLSFLGRINRTPAFTRKTKLIMGKDCNHEIYYSAQSRTLLESSTQVQHINILKFSYFKLFFFTNSCKKQILKVNADLKFPVYVCVHIKAIHSKFRISDPRNSRVIYA